MPKLKVTTWNINSVRTREAAVLEWLEQHSPDILLLQEIKCEQHQFPASLLEHISYNTTIHGEKSYNGVAVLSKYPIDELKTSFPLNPCETQSRFLEVTANTDIGFCRFISLYVPNGGEVQSDKFKMKLEFLEALTEYLKTIMHPDEHLIIGGDINIALEDIDVYNPKALEGSTCFTLEERRIFRKLLNSTGLIDIYRLLNPEKVEFSWWDYRQNAAGYNKGMRIDNILVSPSAADLCINAAIDKEERQKLKASDHAPVYAEFVK